MKFSLGDCVITRAAEDLLRKQQVNPLQYLGRHLNGDDGDLGDEDKARNKVAIATGTERIFSAYNLPSGNRLWIITEYDRSYTTIMLPTDY